MQQMFSTLLLDRSSQPRVSVTAVSPQASGMDTIIAATDSPPIPPSHSVKFLATQIPTFAGSEDEDAVLWLEKLENVARIHGLSPAVLLSAATTKLIKTARRWFDLSPGDTSQSWIFFKEAFLRRFNREVPFSTLIQRAEARMWIFSKESFLDYATDKLALIQRMKLSDRDAIHLLINGISNLAIKASAAAFSTDSLDVFLEKMQRITSFCEEPLKKMSFNTRSSRFKEADVRIGKVEEFTVSTDKMPLQQKAERLNTCVYCHGRDHVRADCPKLKRKQQLGRSASPAQESPVALVEESPEQLSPTVACVCEEPRRVIMDSSTIQVIEVNDSPASISALVDTGSPISFISPSIFERFFSSSGTLTAPNVSYKALDNGLIKIKGVVCSNIRLELLSDVVLSGNFHVLLSKNLPSQVILGRDFLEENNIFLVIDLSKKKYDERIRLFSYVASAEVFDNKSDLENLLNEIVVDADSSTKNNLIVSILEIENEQTSFPEDDYLVKINLKDDTIFAYAPRKFAWTERLQLRDITDDLLARGIIKVSNSPYCARVVPVRKKNGALRLCVDLRPLNKMVVKQKYPFPLIEDCLTRLSNKTVFTLLDLKDGFHQIKLHPDCTKYFSFATPDGQFEYTRLPFGFCESPAEFQKRLVYILQPLIRKDKVIVYIDDILISFVSIEDNISMIRQVLLLLKRYNFQVNYKKCAFLKTTVEYLGYIITPEGITLSSRHVEAVKNFPRPRRILEVQRFLGLTNYFRKFIKDYAAKARPLSDLLKKSVKFNFDES